MKVTREKPEIIRFLYRQEPGDPHYGSCLWAIFDIDPGRGLLNIQSDCGNYAYRWPEREIFFLKLLSGNMTDDYLLSKLCGAPKNFNAEATMKRVMEYLENAEYYDNNELNQLKKNKAVEYLGHELSEYDLENVPEVAEFILDNWNSDNDMHIDCAWELVVKDYGEEQKRIVKIFRDHIVPELRKTTAEGLMS